MKGLKAKMTRRPDMRRSKRSEPALGLGIAGTEVSEMGNTRLTAQAVGGKPGAEKPRVAPAF